MLGDCDNEDEFHFILSAFLSAWRSVLDVMLYDFADHYKIGLSRDDKMFPIDRNLPCKNDLAKNDGVRV
jgi:hypothetical protein